jgi:ATP-binding cassette subfamily B protein
VLFFVIATALLGLATAGLASLSSYIDQIVRFKIESRISDMLYEHFVQLDFWRYDDKKTNDLFEKSQSFINFFAYVLDRAARLFEHLVGMIAALVGLAFISPWLSLALVLAIAPGLVLEYKMSRLQIGHWRKHVTERRKMRYIEYNIIQPNTISELRLYNLAKKMLTLRKMYRDKDQGGRLEFERRFIKWRFLSDVLQSLVQLGSLLWIVVRISERIYPIGQFIFVQQLVGRALGSANSLVSEIGSADEDFAKLYEYNEFMSIQKQRLVQKSLEISLNQFVLKMSAFHTLILLKKYYKVSL